MSICESGALYDDGSRKKCVNALWVGPSGYLHPPPHKYAPIEKCVYNRHQFTVRRSPDISNAILAKNCKESFLNRETQYALERAQSALFTLQVLYEKDRAKTSRAKIINMIEALAEMSE